jgi:hypothetical protein
MICVGKSKRYGCLLFAGLFCRLSDHAVHQKDPQPTQTTVITSDKEIAFFMNRLRTPVIKSEDFASEVMALRAPKEQPEPEKDADVHLEAEELSFWEKMFTRGGNS